MSRRRRTLDLNRKRSALLRCDDISAALKSLAMETLNGHARISDVEHALRLAESTQRLRRNIADYPVVHDWLSKVMSP